MIKKLYHFGSLPDRFLVDFDLQLGKGVLTFGFWSILALGALLGPRWAQDLSKRPSKTDFGGFWDPTWWILGPNLVDFGPQVARFWLDFVPNLSDFWTTWVID